ncbi:hypothetical protein Tco_0368573 [Tanacetum coccineum]
MADLEFVDQHNMVTFLEKIEGNTEFHEIVDFLTYSLIHFVLTVSLTIYISYIEQFWNTATSLIVNDEKKIHAIVDSKAVVVTEASIKSSLLFNDVDGTACLTNEAIFQNLALMGYEGELNKLTFQKALFSPQWKYLIHTILHCLSSKSTSWNELSTNIALAVICLATNQKFNFSKLIFDGMLRNLDNPKKKFLMYPRFLMMFLNNQIKPGEPFNAVYITPAHTLKVFSNMSRKGLKFSGRVTPLFPSMLVQNQAPKGEGGIPRRQDTMGVLKLRLGLRGYLFRSKNHLFQQLTQLEVGRPVLDLEKEKDAQAVEILKLKKIVKKLERQRKSSISHSRRRIYKQIESFNDSLDEEDASKQGRKSDKINPMFQDKDFDDIDDLVNEGMDFEKDEETQGKIGSDDTEVVKVSGDIKEVNTTEEQVGIVRPKDNTARPDVSATDVHVSTTTPPTPPTTTNIFGDEDLTIAQTLIKMKEEKAKEKDKGKGVLVEEEPLKVKRKDQRLAQMESDAELAHRLHEEELAEIARIQEEKEAQKEASKAAIA